MTAIAEKTIKLNLGGCGEGFLDSRIAGFLTVDLRSGPGTDVVCDCSDLSRFESGSVDIIYASNILEHWSLLKTVDVLKEWNRVLKKGGICYISVPDFDVAVTLYKTYGLTTWLNYHLMGDQKHPLNYHYSLFNFGKLAKDLIDAGFSDVKKVKEWPFEVKDGSLNKETRSGLLISLNIGAMK